MPPPQAVAKGLADLQAFGRAKAALAVGEHELIPTDHVNCLLKGKVPLRIYRDLRRMTQVALIEEAGVNRVTVAEIETVRKRRSIALCGLRRCAPRQS